MSVTSYKALHIPSGPGAIIRQPKYKKVFFNVLKDAYILIRCIIKTIEYDNLTKIFELLSFKHVYDCNDEWIKNGIGGKKKKKKPHAWASFFHKVPSGVVIKFADIN